METQTKWYEQIDKFDHAWHKNLKKRYDNAIEDLEYAETIFQFSSIASTHNLCKKLFMDLVDVFNNKIRVQYSKELIERSKHITYKLKSVSQKKQLERYISDREFNTNRDGVRLDFFLSEDQINKKINEYLDYLDRRLAQD